MNIPDTQKASEGMRSPKGSLRLAQDELAVKGPVRPEPKTNWAHPTCTSIQGM